MQAKGIVKFFAIALGLVCLFQLSFTLRTYMVEGNADEYAEQKAEAFGRSLSDLEQQNPGKWLDTVNQYESEVKQTYLDSITNLPVYNLLIKKYTYDQIKNNQLALGLDLQGGMSVIMEVSVRDLLINLASTNATDPQFRRALDEASKERVASDADFVTLFAEAYEKHTNGGRLAAIFATRQNQGLIEPDFDNERIITILQQEAADAVDRTYEILNTRIDQFGVTSPNISPVEGTNRIFIELPGVANPSRVRRLLQAPAALEFWETYTIDELFSALSTADQVIEDALALDEGMEEIPEVDTSAVDTSVAAPDQPVIDPADTNETQPDTGLQTDTGEVSFEDFELGDPTDTTGMMGQSNLGPFGRAINMNSLSQGSPVIGLVEAKDTAQVNRYLKMPEVEGIIPEQAKILWGAQPNDNGFYELYAMKMNPLDNEPALDGDVITDAAQEFDQTTGEPNVTMVMNSEGASQWARITAANVGKFVAIVLDKKVYSAPRVNQEIRGGRSEISGNFTITEAKDLANKLKAGKLPAPARIVQESVVGPTLGAESINAGVKSMVAGLLLVLLFMIFYYAKAGVVSNIALVLNIFFIFGLLASLGATLTLPGIAGIVLTIGMAVDANVIIFERVREEVLRGKGDRLALVDGYRQSYSAIIDANVTTLITAFILFYFGLGPVKGFATVLIIGIFSSLFTAVLISRVIFEWMLKRDMKITVGNKATLKMLSNVSIDFLKKRKVAYVISGILVVVSLASFMTRGFELGVDFKGGRQYHMRFEQPVDAQEIRDAMTPVFNDKTPIVKTVAASNEVKITTDYLIDSTGNRIDSLVETALMAGLQPFLTDPGELSREQFTSKYVLESITVQPTIAKDIKNTSLVATIVALIGIFLYILFRFRRWQYSVGALAALAHDVIIVLGIFSLFHGIFPFAMEIDQPFIAAILTVIGYSINDTVIVFDRIREFLAERKKGGFIGNVNDALSATLSRTLITSGTTFLVIAVLFIFGGEAIRGFSFAILIGIFVGTYSSLFVASPVMSDLTKNKKAAAEQA